jgi:hypothetical protein
MIQQTENQMGLPERIGTIIGQAVTAFIYAVVLYLVLTPIRF